MTEIMKGNAPDQLRGAACFAARKVAIHPIDVMLDTKYD